MLWLLDNRNDQCIDALNIRAYTAIRSSELTLKSCARQF